MPLEGNERFGIYKLEYEKTAERYENIYRAIWQNFSYMAALSGGILAFGTDALSMPTVLWVALLPLLFWYFATFIPMDSYARQARRRAARIEEIITKEFIGVEPTGQPKTSFWDRLKGPQPRLPETKFWDRLKAGPLAAILYLLMQPKTQPNSATVDRELRHFREFGETDPRVHLLNKALWRMPHVSTIVHPVMWFAVYLALKWATAEATTTRTAPTSALEVRIPAPVLDSAQYFLLLGRLDSVSSELRSARLGLDSLAAKVDRDN